MEAGSLVVKGTGESAEPVDELGHRVGGISAEPLEPETDGKQTGLQSKGQHGEGPEHALEPERRFLEGRRPAWMVRPGPGPVDGSSDHAVERLTGGGMDGTQIQVTQKDGQGDVGQVGMNNIRLRDDTEGKATVLPENEPCDTKRQRRVDGEDGVELLSG